MFRSIFTAIVAATILFFSPVPGFVSAACAGSLLFSNNASTTVALALSSSATSVTVAASTGSRFPAITAAGQHFRATFVKNGTPSQYEIVLVTADSGDTFTITRGQEGTTAQSWRVGDFFNLFLTASDLNEFAQTGDLQAQSGNYAVDSGSSNAYSVTLSPALAQHVVGLPIRVRFSNTNTGASTFNDGAGSLPLLTPDLSNLVAGNVQGNGIGIVIYDGARFQLLSPYKVSFAQITGQVGTAQVPLSAVAQFEPQLYTSPNLTGTPTAPTPWVGNDSTQIATTDFVRSAIANALVVSQNLSSPGYVRLNGGLIVEWGGPTNGGTTIAFDGSLPGTTPMTLFAPMAIAEAGGPVQAYLVSVTSNSFKVNTTGGPFYWIAVGF